MDATKEREIMLETIASQQATIRKLVAAISEQPSCFISTNSRIYGVKDVRL